MKLIFNLSKQNLKLSKAEVLSVFNTDEYKLLDNYLILDPDINDKTREYQKQQNKINRLAYTKSIYQLLFMSKPKNLTDNIKKYDWKQIYKTNFCVRVKNSKIPTDRYVADLIWDNLEKNKIKPKAKLDNSKTEIHFIFTKTKVIIAKLLHQNKENFSGRKPHKRPELSPTSLDPRLARAMINLSGIRLNETLIDPFCGVGGILIEYGLLGGKCIGYDINNIELKKCKINLDHYKTNQTNNKLNYKLINKDALTINKQYKYVVTDLPYGRNTKVNKELKQLYKQFLELCGKKIKPKTIVIGVPDFINFRTIIKQSKYKIRYNFKIYIHKGLTKEVYVLI